MLLITSELACRLETAEAVDAAGCAEAQCVVETNCDAAVQSIAGGVAVFCGASSPLTHALGMGMHGPVSAEDMDAVELFFQSRGAAVVIDVCPHADPTLRDLASQRGYRIVEFLNVMVRNADPAELSASSIEVRPAVPEDRETYVSTVIGGFFGRQPLTPEEATLGTTLFHMPCTTAYLAWIDGQPAGGGGMSIRNKIASFFGDATLPEYRGKGVHSATIRARIADAMNAGCELMTAGTTPGSASQRNYQRLGFHVAYTKATMVLE